MDRSEAEAILVSRGLLSVLPEETRRWWLDLGDVVRIGKGQVLYSMENPGDGLYGLISGSVGVSLARLRGGTSLVHVFRPGWWFGEEGATVGGRRRGGTQTMEPVVALHAPAGRLNEFLERMPAAHAQVTQMSLMNRRLGYGALADLMIRRMACRIGAVLLRVCGVWDSFFLLPDNGATVRLAPTEPMSLTQGQLALMANASRDAVNRTLAQFEAAGWVRLGYNRVAILDPEPLADFAYGTGTGGVIGKA